DALRAYTEGRRALLRRDDARALTLLQSAVKLDSTFATAWRSLRAAIGSSPGGRYRDQYDAMVQAHRYADRLPPAERDLVEEEYYASNKLDRATALRLRERYLLAGDTVNVNNTARRYMTRREFGTAETLLRAEVSRDSGFNLVIQRGSLLIALVDQGKLAAADSMMGAWNRAVGGRFSPLQIVYNSRGIEAYRRALDSIDKAHPHRGDTASGNLALTEG